MALPNAYKAYSNSKLMTASPAQLTLMLYALVFWFQSGVFVFFLNVQMNKFPAGHVKVSA